MTRHRANQFNHFSLACQLRCVKARTVLDPLKKKAHSKISGAENMSSTCVKTLPLAFIGVQHAE